ncbi:MAG: hypothetical protein J6128_02030, partial [Clostridia bacterium]|nr:hypothetical protein [Clostridia bacterium]
KKLFRIAAAVLCMVMFLGAFSMIAAAEGTDEIDARIVSADTQVYGGGVFDIYAASSTPNATFQWVSRSGPDASDVPVTNNNVYKGTNTDHLQIITLEGVAVDTLQFACKVTVNGKSKLTSWIDLVILSQEDLRTKLESNPITITKFEPKSLASAGTIDDLPAYSTTAGNKITFDYSTSDMPKEFEQSEITLVNEINLFSGGKTATYDSANGYMSDVVGDRAVRATLSLQLYINDVFFSTLDTKTVIISQSRPAFTGAVSAKEDGYVLDGMSDSANRLISYPKDAYLNLIAENGDWLKVSYRDVIGYVPAAGMKKLAAQDTIIISIKEPIQKSTPDLTPVMGGSGYALNSGSNAVKWFNDSYIGAEMQSGETFLAGNEYRAVIQIKAADGTVFPVSNELPAVQAWVNGSPCSVSKVEGQDPAKVIAVSYESHAHSLTNVPKVDATCTKDGMEEHYECNLCGARFKDSYGLVSITSENWGVIPALGHLPSDWQSDGSKHYRYCLRKNCGIKIPGTVANHTGGTATCVNKAICEVCNLPYGELTSHNYSSDYLFQDATGHAHLCTEPLCNSHDKIIAHTPGPEATETKPQICEVCGYIITPAKSHVHTLKEVKAVDADCTTPGSKGYWECTDCGKIFEDEKAEKEIESKDSLVIEALGHTESAEWKFDADSHWKLCSKCSAVIEDTKASHTLEKGKCTVCGYTKEAETTSPPVTTPPDTTKAPVTTPPPVTTKAQDTTAPITTAPKDDTTDPDDTTADPDETTDPDDTTEPEETTGPADDTTVPEETTGPEDDTTVPDDTTAPGGNGTKSGGAPTPLIITLVMIGLVVLAAVAMFIVMFIKGKKR